MRRATRHIFAATLLLCLAGCGKADYDTHLILKPRVIQTASSPAGGEAAFMVRVYACYVNENELLDTWKVSSYADADAGIFTNVKTGEQRDYGFMAEQMDTELMETEEDSYIHFTFSRSPVALVAVDQVNRFYAYRVMEIPTPLETLGPVVVRFVLHKTEVSFKDSEWIVVNGTLQDQQAEEDEE